MEPTLAILAAVVGGVMVFLSFPTFDLYPLAWLAYVPLLVLVERGPAKRAFWLGWLSGTVTNAGGFYWMGTMLQEFGHLHPVLAWPVAALLFAYQGLVPALWLGVGRFATARLPLSPVLVYPLVYAAVEFLVPFLFPWYLANGQARFLPFIQAADLGGVPLLTWMVVLGNAALARAVSWLFERGAEFPRRAVFLPVLVLGAALLYGVVRIEQVDRAVQEAPKLRVGMVEANVGIWEKEARYLAPDERVRTLYKNLMTHQRLSAEVQQAGAELIVWPESSYIPYGAPWVKVTDRFFLAAGRGLEVLSRGPADPWVRETPDDLRAGLPGDGRDLAIRGIWGPRDDDLVLVGDGGVVVRFDGTTFRRLKLDLDEDLRGVSGTRRRGAVFVGSRGGVYALEGEAERALRKPDGASLRAIGLVSGETLVAVGDGGLALRVDADGVTRESTPTDADLLGVDPPWAVGRGGVVLHRKARGAWERVEVPTTATLFAVRELGDGSALAVGEGGAAVLLRAGGRSAPVDAPTDRTLRAVATYRGRAVAVGDRGAVLAFDAGTRQWSREQLPFDADLAAVRGLEPFPVTFLPRDVRWLYRSDEPLPTDADPAAAVEAYLKAPTPDRDTVQRGFDRPVMLGVITRDEDTDQFFNTSILLSEAGRVEGLYDKNHLLLFGEYLPLADRFPVLRQWIPEAGRFTPGTTVEVMPFGEHRIGALICYEDLSPSFTRKLAGKRPNLLINVTNDAWFGKTTEPWQHLALALFRSVETRLYLLRSTNTGVSAVIDPAGRLVAASDLDQAETLVEQVAWLEGDTVYLALGDWFAWSAVGLTALFALAGLVRSNAVAPTPAKRKVLKPKRRKGS